MAQVTVKASGGDYTSLKTAIDAAETDILISGTFAALPYETNNITWDTAAVTVTCDSDAQWYPNSPRAGGTYHYSLHGTSNGSNVITVSGSGSGTLEGIETKQASTGDSDEGIRHIHSNTFDHSKLLVWTANATTNQDGVYCYHGYTPTLNFENCYIVDCYRAGINYQKYATSSGNTTTISINSSVMFSNAAGNDAGRGGVVGYLSNVIGTSGCDFYIYNSISCGNDSRDFEVFNTVTLSFTIDQCVYTIDSTEGLATITDSVSGVAFSDTSQGATYVNVEEDDTAPYDLRLDGTAGCEALEMHSDAAGPNSMAMPSDDIMGTSRTAPYCCGAFEYGEAGGLTVSTSQSISLSESITISGLLASIDISLFEQITLAEFIAPAMPLAGILVDETMDLAEALTPDASLIQSTSQQITITEFLSLLENIAPNAFEQITVTEYVSLLKNLGFDTSQAINVSELITAAVESAGPNSFDNITINEVISAFMDMAGIDTSQAINISEFVTTLTTDSTIINKFESINVSEAITLIFDVWNLTGTENINISESITAFLETTGIDVSDSINISEYVLSLMALGVVSKSESVTLSEAITLFLETQGTFVLQTINISEAITTILAVTGVDISQSISISEFVYVTTVTVAGMLEVALSAMRPKVAFNASKPKIQYTTGGS